MVDWIEMIPFTETRIYVQRVLENLQIYRGQNGDTATAFSLVADLAR
jgi:soluble lytic murein transglycosylase